AFAGGNAAQVRVAHSAEDFTRVRGQAGKRLLELLDGPSKAADQQLDALARALDRNGFIVELAGGVAVGRALPFQEPSDQRAVVRLVVLDGAENFPAFRLPGKGFHVD